MPNEITENISKLQYWIDKHLKDPQTGAYKNYLYPDFIDIPFNPVTDEYPYPVDAMDITYDGLHPSDKGDSLIARMLVKIMKKY